MLLGIARGLQTNGNCVTQNNIEKFQIGSRKFRVKRVALRSLHIHVNSCMLGRKTLQFPQSDFLLEIGHSARAFFSDNGDVDSRHRSLVHSVFGECRTPMLLVYEIITK